MSAFIVSNKTLKRIASIIANVCNDNEPAITGKAAEKSRTCFPTVIKMSIRLQPDCTRSMWNL